MPAFLISSEFPVIVSFPNDPFEKVANGIQQLIRWGTVLNVGVPNTETNTVRNRFLINFGRISHALLNEDAPEDDDRFVLPLSFDDTWRQAVMQEENRLRLDHEGPGYLDQ